MGGFINQLTSPLGVRLFPGGPYPDAGQGDVAQKNVATYMQQLAPIIAAIAQQSGVVNPLTGQTQGVPMAGGTAPGDPYGLTALDQAQVNKQASIDSKTYDKILSSVKADLSARGMSDSSTLGAAEAYLKQQLSGQLAGEQIQAGENAFQNRQTAMQQIASLLSGQYGAQQQVTQQAGQLAMEKQGQSMNQLGSLLGFFAGGGLGGKKGPGGVPGGTPPISNPAAGVNTTGAGIPPGQVMPPLGNINPTINWPNIWG